MTTANPPAGAQEQAPDQAPAAHTTARRRRAAPPAAKSPAAERRRCTSTVAATGAPCPAAPLANEPRCVQHSLDPKVIEKRQVAQALGGLRTQMKALAGVAEQVPAEIRTREGVTLLLQRTVDEVRGSVISPSVANSIKGLCDSALRLAELELSAKVAALEAQVEEASRVRR